MDIRKYITKKNVIIGAVAGTAIIGGIVALVVRHRKKKENDEFLHEEEEISVSPEIAERVAKYHEAAENLLKELENGTYGK